MLAKAKELKMYEQISSDICVNSQTKFFEKKEEKTNQILKKKETMNMKMSMVNIDFNSSEAMSSEKVRRLSAVDRQMYNNIHKNMKIKPQKKEVKDSKDLKKFFIGPQDGLNPIKETDDNNQDEINQKGKNSDINNSKGMDGIDKKTIKEIASITSYEQHFGAAKKQISGDKSEVKKRESNVKDSKEIRDSKEFKEIKDIGIKNEKSNNLQSKAKEENNISKVEVNDKENDKIEKLEKLENIEKKNASRQSNSISIEKKKRKKVKTISQSSQDINDSKDPKVITNDLKDAAKDIKEHKSSKKIKDPEYKKNIINKNKIENFLNEELTAASFFKQVISPLTL